MPSVKNSSEAFILSLHFSTHIAITYRPRQDYKIRPLAVIAARENPVRETHGIMSQL